MFLTATTIAITTAADEKAIAETWAAVRENFRGVVRWRALYSRKRPLMARLPSRAGNRLHGRLKDLEDDAMEAHRAAEHRLLELLFNGGEPIRTAPLVDCTGKVIREGW